jgi:putative FmdB family regulatory protein
MPIRETQCGDCGHEWDQLLRADEAPEACPHCESKKVHILVSAHGGYIGNMGGGSVRPKNAGSFKRAKRD